MWPWPLWHAYGAAQWPYYYYYYMHVGCGWPHGAVLVPSLRAVRRRWWAAAAGGPQEAHCLHATYYLGGVVRASLDLSLSESVQPLARCVVLPTRACHAGRQRKVRWGWTLAGPAPRRLSRAPLTASVDARQHACPPPLNSSSSGSSNQAHA